MFKEIRKVQVPEYDGTATIYQHECGMEVLHIKNNSEELCGSFVFSTISEDDTGVAHIIEHTVLSGSERYPVKDPFSQILLTSPNTFLNAMTFPDKTMYPFASPLKKDFDIIFDIYADAVFAPLLRKESFNQEGVRFCSDAIDGVVFNEMRGAFSSEDDIVSRFSTKKLFEGTPAQFESGGDPRFIPDLTYEAYIARYKKWYSPANCRLFLYGKMDAFEYLNRIEKLYLTKEHLSRFDNKKFIAPSDNYLNPKAKPEIDVQLCPTENASTVLLNWLTTKSDDPFEILTLSVLTDILLGNPGAPLYKAIIDSGLGDDLSACSGMESDFPMLAFSVGFTGAKKNAEKEIESFLMNELTKLAKEGINRDQQVACLKRQKFKLQEIPGDGYPYGILVAIRAARYWLRGKDPISCIDNVSLYNRLVSEFEKGRFFEDWILNNLVNNPRRCLLTVKEDPKFESNLQKLLDTKYRALRESCSDEEFNEEKSKYEAFVNTEDSQENLDKIPRISKSDLPQNIPCFALKNEKRNGVEIRYMNTFTRGITYINIAFDATSLTEEELELFPLLTRAIQMCGTKKHTYPEIGVLINMLTGRFSIIDSSGTKQDGSPAVYMILRSSSLTDDVSASMELIREIMLESDLSDLERISASITDLITDWESEYLYSGNAYASMYCAKFLSHSGKVNDMINGTSGYLSTKKYENAEKETLKKLSEKLEAIRTKIVCRQNMIVEYCCDEENNKDVFEKISNLCATYPEGTKLAPAEFYSTKFVPDYQQKYVAVSSGPAYNAVSFILKYEGERKLVCAALISAILNSGYMIENIRGKGGAYGAGCHLDLSEKVLLCYSYRDPNIEKTLDWYKEAFRSEISEQNIDYTVAAIIGKELKPFVPKAKCYEAFRRSLYGLTDELYLERRKAILSISLDELKTVCKELYEQISTRATKATVCGKEMIKDNSSDILYLSI